MRALIVLLGVLTVGFPATAPQAEGDDADRRPGVVAPEPTDAHPPGALLAPRSLEQAPGETEARSAPPAGFRLDLSSLPSLPPNEFTLFYDPFDSREAQLGLLGDYPCGARAGTSPPTAIAMPTVIRWDVGENAGFDVTLFSLDREEWSELDTWEKIGWVTARASAIVGAAALLESLF